MKIRIYYEDTDAGGIVYHSNYLNFFERARSEMFFSNGVTPFNEDEHFVVRNVAISFKYPAKLGDILEIKTTLKQMKKASCILRQMAYLGDTLVCCADVNLAFTKKAKPAKIPEQFIKVLECYTS